MLLCKVQATRTFKTTRTFTNFHPGGFCCFTSTQCQKLPGCPSLAIKFSYKTKHKKFWAEPLTRVLDPKTTCRKCLMALLVPVFGPGRSQRRWRTIPYCTPDKHWKYWFSNIQIWYNVWLVCNIYAAYKANLEHFAKTSKMTHHCDWQAHVETNRLACNSLFSESLIGVSQIRFWVTLGSVLPTRPY